MIVKRKYANYGQLMKDPNSKEVIYNAIRGSNPTIENEFIDKIMQADSNLIVANTDIGSGIPGDAYQNIIKEFEKLDKEKPFENGLTYRDVTNALCFPSKQGRAIMQVLYKRIYDLAPVIVQVIAFESDGNGIRQIDEWDIGEIIL